MIWLENIKAFFSDNAPTITAWLTPANIIAMATAIVMIVKNARGTKKNTDATTALAGNIDKIDNLVDSVKANSDVVSCQVESVKELDYKYDNITGKIADVESIVNNRLDALENKILAMLDVQSMVYSTIQNDDLRMNVQNKIANAKIATDTTREELKQKIENLKEELNTVVSNVSEKLEESSGELKSVVDNKTKTVRY